MKKIILYSLIFFLYSNNVKAMAATFRSNICEFISGPQNSIYSTNYDDTSPDFFTWNSYLLSEQIDTSFKDVTGLMNEITYNHYKNKKIIFRKEKAEPADIRDSKNSLLRFPSDSIDINEAGRNFIDSKNYLSNAGIDFNFAYTADAALDYGLKYMGDVDLKLSVDFNKALQLSGLKGYLYILGDHGDKIRDLTGTAQGISNIEAASTWKLYELWLEQTLCDDKLSFLFGLYDLNTEFDTRETSSLFINPSQAIGPDFSQSGQNGPSIFPTTSLALRIKYNFLNNFTLLTAAFDGVPGDQNNPLGTHVILNRHEGLLITNEVDYASESGYPAGFLKFGAGSWFYTSKFDDLLDVDNNGDPVKREGNMGFYFWGEKKFIMSENFPVNEIAFYLRTGTANENVNLFNAYYGGGITFKGLLGRNDDLLGISFAFAHNSYKYRKLLSYTDIYPTEVHPFETVWEVVYNFQLNSYIVIQPDLQFISHPSLSSIYDYLLVPLLRVRFSY